MRSDSLNGIEKVEKYKSQSTYCIEGKTVFPSVTLPCHMSLFHSVPPTRHGTTTNVYAPQVRPVCGLVETLKAQGKKSAMFYTWEALRDVARPLNLVHSLFHVDYDSTADTCRFITDNAKDYINKETPDFAFVYYHAPDVLGHKKGWMSKEYLDAVAEMWDYIDELVNSVPSEYSVIITADHGGHDRIHGTESKEDTTIPFFLMGERFEKGKAIQSVNIIDLAPTITDILGIRKDEEWEGKSLC